MHGPIRDRLEILLGAEGENDEAAAHLRSCAQCSSELNALKQQSTLLATLKTAESEPAAGFYARVMQRIEEQDVATFWSFFVDSPFSKRLALASLTIAVALGSYVVSQESREQRFGSRIMALNSPLHYDAPVTGSQSEQRDATLENFASHNLIERQGQIR